MTAFVSNFGGTDHNFEKKEEYYAYLAELSTERNRVLNSPIAANYTPTGVTNAHVARYLQPLSGAPSAATGVGADGTAFALSSDVVKVGEQTLTAAFGEANIATDDGEFNMTAYIQNSLGDYWSRQYSDLMGGMFEGVASQSLAFDGAGGATDTKLSLDSIYGAAEEFFGDDASREAYLVVNKYAYNSLRQAELIDFVAPSSVALNLPSVGGYPVVVDSTVAGRQTDSLESALGLTLTGNVNALNFSYLAKPGAVRFGLSPLANGLEVESNPAAYSNTGATTVYSRMHLGTHVNGVSLADASVALPASRADMVSEGWQKVWADENIGFCAIVSN